MGDLGLKIGRQVDDMDGSKGTFLGADTTTDAQSLRDEGDLGLGGHLDAQLSRANDRTGLFAFLTTFLWLSVSLFVAATFTNFRFALLVQTKSGVSECSVIAYQRLV